MSYISRKAELIDESTTVEGGMVGTSVERTFGSSEKVRVSMQTDSTAGKYKLVMESLNIINIEEMISLVCPINI